MTDQELISILLARFPLASSLSAWLNSDIWPLYKQNRQNKLHTWNERLRAEAEMRRAARREAKAREAREKSPPPPERLQVGRQAWITTEHPRARELHARWRDHGIEPTFEEVHFRS